MSLSWGASETLHLGKLVPNTFNSSSLQAINLLSGVKSALCFLNGAMPVPTKLVSNSQACAEVHSYPGRISLFTTPSLISGGEHCSCTMHVQFPTSHFAPPTQFSLNLIL